MACVQEKKVHKQRTFGFFIVVVAAT